MIVQPPRRAPSEITDENILAALRENEYNIIRTAEALGVSTSWLHPRINKSPNIPKASKLTKEEILECQTLCGGDIDAMAKDLEVSGKALMQQMRQLKLL